MISQHEILSGVIVDDDDPLTLAELCASCAITGEAVITLVEHGIVETVSGVDVAGGRRVSRNSVLRVQTALRLQRDLNVNVEGAALALDLLEEIKRLRRMAAGLEKDSAESQ